MKKCLLLMASFFVLGNASPVLAQDINVDEVIEQRKKDSKELEAVELFTGVWIVGVDIEPGRYEITGSNMGNLFIDSDQGESTNEILVDVPGDMGVSSITTDLYDGDEIEISGINAVYFEPYETELKDFLGTGTWVVGVDIEPGNYTASTKSGMGNFFVDGGSRSVNEILSAPNKEMGVEKVALSLEEGQVIRISGLESVDFTKR